MLSAPFRNRGRSEAGDFYFVSSAVIFLFTESKYERGIKDFPRASNKTS